MSYQTLPGVSPAVGKGLNHLLKRGRGLHSLQPHKSPDTAVGRRMSFIAMKIGETQLVAPVLPYTSKKYDASFLLSFFLAC